MIDLRRKRAHRQALALLETGIPQGCQSDGSAPQLADPEARALLILYKCRTAQTLARLPIFIEHVPLASRTTTTLAIAAWHPCYHPRTQGHTVGVTAVGLSRITRGE